MKYMYIDSYKKQQQHRSYKIFQMGWIQVTIKIEQDFFQKIFAVAKRERG